jgi:protein-tyrosine-phosphatase
VVEEFEALEALTDTDASRGEIPRKHVAVVGAFSPDRVLVLASMLAEEVARHGWSERLEVTPAGVGAGAGDADDAVVARLAAAGIELGETSCPDVELDASLLDDADCFLVASGGEADELLQWREAEGKEVMAVADCLDENAEAIEDPFADLEAFVAEVREALPDVLRMLVAERL